MTMTRKNRYKVSPIDVFTIQIWCLTRPNILRQVDMKNVVECQEDFFAYLNSLETYDDRLKSCTYNEKEKRKSLDKTDPHVLVQLLVGGGGIFLLKSYNTREHSVCGLAKLIWRASEDTKYMARKKGGDTIIWNSYCPRKRPTTPRRSPRRAAGW